MIVGQAVAALEGVCGHLWAILGTGSEVEVQRCEAPASREFALLRWPATASATRGGVTLSDITLVHARLASCGLPRPAPKRLAASAHLPVGPSRLAIWDLFSFLRVVLVFVMGENLRVVY